MSDHVAIMKKSWGLTQKILKGEKTIETRWYKHKSRPWNLVKIGDSVYFKDSGSLVTVVAKVSKVEQYEDLNEKRIYELFKKYSEADLGTGDIPDEIKEYVKGKNYSIIIHLKNPKALQPFDINKKGFGAMAAWLTVDNIDSIRK